MSEKLLLHVPKGKVAELNTASTPKTTAELEADPEAYKGELGGIMCLKFHLMPH